MAISLTPVNAALDMTIADAQTASAIAALERLRAHVSPIADVVDLSDMSDLDACAALGVLPGASWESIELARRGIVQLSHPDNVSKLPAAKRAKLVAAAVRANCAYALLHRLRSQ